MFILLLPCIFAALWFLRPGLRLVPNRLFIIKYWFQSVSDCKISSECETNAWWIIALKCQYKKHMHRKSFICVIHLCWSHVLKMQRNKNKLGCILCCSSSHIVRVWSWVSDTVRILTHDRQSLVSELWNWLNNCSTTTKNSFSLYSYRNLKEASSLEHENENINQTVL